MLVHLIKSLWKYLIYFLLVSFNYLSITVTDKPFSLSGKLSHWRGENHSWFRHTVSSSHTVTVYAIYQTLCNIDGSFTSALWHLHLVQFVFQSFYSPGIHPWLLRIMIAYRRKKKRKKNWPNHVIVTNIIIDNTR